MKASELRDKDVAGLNQELSELLKAQFGLRMQKATQQLQNTSQLKKVVAITVVKVKLVTLAYGLKLVKLTITVDQKCAKLENAN